MKFSKPVQQVTEAGIVYLIRTTEQVESDLLGLKEAYGNIADADFLVYWRKMLSAKIPVCPLCGQSGGPIRRTRDGSVMGCDRCLEIQGQNIDLVGVKEAAAILGWDVRRVTTYRSRGSFPVPVAELAMGPLWTKSQIEAYKNG